MNTKQRILSILLLEKLDQNPTVTQRIEVEMNTRKGKENEKNN